MARRYPPEFRRKVLDLVAAGRPVAEVAQALGVSRQTIYNWRNQDRIDRGEAPGLTSAERDELNEPTPQNRGNINLSTKAGQDQ